MWGVVKGTLGFIPKMWAVLLMMVIDGLSLGVYSSQIPHLMPPDIESTMVNKVAGIAMITLGIGAVCGGFLCGPLSDRKGSLLAGRVGLFCWLGSCGVFLVALNWPALWLMLLASFTWGFSLFFIEGWMYVVCSRNYGGRAEAFSVNKQLHSWFFLFFQGAVFATNTSSAHLPLGYLLPGMMVLALPAFILIARIPQS